MVQKIAGPGVGLPLPQNLFPTELAGAAQDISSNRITLAGGNSFVVPAGEWLISLGMYCFLQMLDPLTGEWFMIASGGWENGPLFVVSDGYNIRVANMTGCPIGGVVTSAGGTAYVQSSTTISVVGGGGSTWVPIVGGQVSLSSITAAGAGYGVAPLVMIPPPPPANTNPNGVGGIPATAFANIASGTVSGITFTNPGAGYPTNLTLTLQPSPFDPNLVTGITLGTIVLVTYGGGSVTGALCTNSGAPITNPANITLTVAGAGTNATVVPIMCQTVITGSVTGGGTGWGTTNALLSTVAGYPPTSTFARAPESLFLRGKVRPAAIQLAVTGTGTVAVQAGIIYDGGLFYGTPTPIVMAGQQSGAAGSQAGPTIALTMGSAPDIVVLQPAP